MENNVAKYIFLVGAAKSGTTKLADLFDLHPDVCLANGKEPDTFLTNEVTSKSLQQYNSLFDKNSNVRVDASTSYTETRNTIEIAKRLYNVDPQANIIYIVRDPVKRAWSSYWHYVRNGLEKGKPIEAISSHDSPHFIGSRYFQQMSAFETVFPRSQINVVFFEDFVRNTDEVYKKILSVLSLNEYNLRRNEASETKNKSYQWRGAASFIKHVNPTYIQKIAKALKKLLPNRVVMHLKDMFTKPVPDIENTTYIQLSELFKEDFNSLKDQFADCFITSESWKKKR